MKKNYETVSLNTKIYASSLFLNFASFLSSILNFSLQLPNFRFNCVLINFYNFRLINLYYITLTHIFSCIFRCCLKLFCSMYTNKFVFQLCLHKFNFSASIFCIFPALMYFLASLHKSFHFASISGIKISGR